MKQSFDRPLPGLPRALALGSLSAAVGFALWLVAGGAAGAHEAHGVQYPPMCCHSAAEVAWGDCAPIANKYVTAEPDGYHVNLPAGAHPRLKTKGYSAIIPYSQARQPLSDEYHICLSENGGTRFCFFPVPMGS